MPKKKTTTDLLNIGRTDQRTINLDHNTLKNRKAQVKNFKNH